MKEYASFLGCIIPNRYPGIEAVSTRILKDFDIGLIPINGASCCPAPGVFSSFHLESWLAIAARNLALGENTGRDIITMCNGCYGSLTEASYLLNANRELKEKINEILSKVGCEFKGTSKIKHMIEVFSEDVGVKKIQESMKNALEGVRVCTHYGCHFLKPTEIKKHGSSEQPRLLDDIVRATGAESVDYKDKTMCCGFGGGVRARDIEVTLDFTREKLNNILAAGGDCIVDQCASCHLEFDRGQAEIKKIYGEEFRLPVLYFTQLIGLGLGMESRELGLNFQNVPAGHLLVKIKGGRK
jgi:heterodisulfide reductase subunit B